MTREGRCHGPPTATFEMRTEQAAAGTRPGPKVVTVCLATFLSLSPLLA